MAKIYQPMTDQEAKKTLTDLQYNVIKKSGTERAFDNPYWNHKADGIYVDLLSGEPLFSSRDKYDSGTGWPSFTQPIDPQFIKFKKDIGLFGIRTEVRSTNGDAHLGHVFGDGPGPRGERYCMNSASLRFVPISNMKDEGYEDYLVLFEA